MSFNFFTNDAGNQLKVASPATRKRRATSAPEAPTLEAPPTRDLADEAQKRVPGAILATALSLLLNPRRAAGTVANYLKGASAGADANYQNKLADNQRTNATAVQQYGANRQRFGDERMLDAADRQDELDAQNQDFRERSWTRQGEQIQYGRGRDAVGDARYNDGRAFRDTQFQYTKERDNRNWDRTKILDDRSAALAGLQAMESYGRFTAPLDAKSQKSVSAAATPLLQKLNVQPFAEPLTVAPKPADPYKMGMLKLQQEKLGQLKIWQSGKLLEGQGRNAIAGQNVSLRAGELALRTGVAQFNQQMEAAKMNGITPEDALSLSMKAMDLSANPYLTPEDRGTMQDMAKNLRSMAGGNLPLTGNVAPSVSPYSLPSGPSSSAPQFRKATPPAPTVGYRPPSRPLTKTPVINPMAQAGNRGGFKPAPAKPAPKKIKASDKKSLTAGF